MDFVDWCGVVLDRLVARTSESREARMSGVSAEQLARLLFGGSVVDKPNFKSSTRYVALEEALRALLREGRIRYVDGVDGRFPGPVKLTDRGHDGSAGLARSWGWSRLERLEPEHMELIELVNQHSEHQASDHAWLEGVEESRIFAQHSLAEDSSFLEHVVREIGLDSNRGLIASGVNSEGVRMLYATYEGLVWGTRRGSPLPFDQQFRFLTQLREAQYELELDFAFVVDDALRVVLIEDFRQARISHVAGAFKAASILYATVIEGMLLDPLKRQEAQAREEFASAVKRLRLRANQDGTLDWDRVSLEGLLNLATKFGFVSATDSKLVDAAKDYRDTVHPQNAARNTLTAGAEDADVLQAVASLIHARLAPRTDKE